MNFDQSKRSEAMQSLSHFHLQVIEDPVVIAAFLGGSRGRTPSSANSDFDLFVVVSEHETSGFIETCRQLVLEKLPESHKIVSEHLHAGYGLQFRIFCGSSPPTELYIFNASEFEYGPMMIDNVVLKDAEGLLKQAIAEADFASYNRKRSADLHQKFLWSAQLVEKQLNKSNRFSAMIYFTPLVLVVCELLFFKRTGGDCRDFHMSFLSQEPTDDVISEIGFDPFFDLSLNGIRSSVVTARRLVDNQK